MDAMTFFVLAASAMAALSLVSGVVSMAQGGASDDEHANQLMFRRTAWQGLAVLLVMLGLIGSF